MRQIIRVVGYTLIGLVFAGLCVEVVSALLAGKPFYGRSYYGLDLGTYGAALTIVVVLGVGLFLATRWAVRRVFRRTR